MERAVFINKFSQRLSFLLRKEGYISNKGQKNIEISTLAKTAEVSYQMARKYILGLALPDYHVIQKIANWLKVSPSWLLFGENKTIDAEPKTSNLIEIDVDLLRYILNKSTLLFPSIEEAEKIVNYIVGVIYDASHIEADRQTIIKIIDLMYSSGIQLAELKFLKRVNNA